MPNFVTGASEPYRVNICQRSKTFPRPFRVHEYRLCSLYSFVHTVCRSVKCIATVHKCNTEIKTFNGILANVQSNDDFIYCLMLCNLKHFTFTWNMYTWFCFFLVFDFLSVLRGHSFFSSPPQRPMTSDFEGFSIPDFIHYIYFPILILEKEPVFSFLNVQW